MRTRHLVSLVTGILIFSVLVPVCLSIWLAHRQAEDKFVDALDSYASRVLIRTDRVVAQAKQALTHLQTFHAPPCTPPHLREMRRVEFSWRYIQEVMYIDNLKPLCSSLEQSSNTAILPPRCGSPQTGIARGSPRKTTSAFTAIWPFWGKDIIW